MYTVLHTWSLNGKIENDAPGPYEILALRFHHVQYIYSENTMEPHN